MPLTEVNGIQLYYEAHGEGFPIVFLHGYSSTHHMWRAQVPNFSKDYRFIIYDARGHGQTESPPSVDQYSADIVVEDLYQLLKALEIEKAVIGGLSMGGYESLRFYLTHPEMVKALVLMDTGPGYRNLDRMAEWNRGLEERAKRLETEGIEVLAANAPTEARRDIMLKQNPVGLAHMARMVVGQHDSKVIDNLENVGVPTLVLVGENDRPFLVAGQVMAKKIPSSVHVIIPDAGHAANIDNTEVFNQEVLGFLNQLDL